MSYTLLPLVGLRSLVALRGVQTLLFGLKCLPAYVAVQYEEFYAAFLDMDEARKETLLREAVAFVPLSDEETAALLSFAADANGIPFGPANTKQLPPDQLFEIIVAVAMSISRIKVDLVSEEEKKKSRTLASTSERPSPDIRT